MTCAAFTVDTPGAGQGKQHEVVAVSRQPA